MTDVPGSDVPLTEPSTPVEKLPRDLDGTPYRVVAALGAWKVTPCCGAFAKGGDDGVYCRGCYENIELLGANYYDGPAHLDPTQDPQPPRGLRISFGEDGTLQAEPARPAAGFEWPRDVDGEAARPIATD